MSERERQIDVAVREGLARFRPTMRRQHAKFAKPTASGELFACRILQRLMSGRARYEPLMVHIRDAWREAHK